MPVATAVAAEQASAAVGEPADIVAPKEDNDHVTKIHVGQCSSLLLRNNTSLAAKRTNHHHTPEQLGSFCRSKKPELSITQVKTNCPNRSVIPFFFSIILPLSFL